MKSTSWGKQEEESTNKFKKKMKRKGNCGYIPVKKNFYFIEKIEEKLYKLPLMKQMLQNKVDITFQANKYIYHPNKKMRKKTI